VLLALATAAACTGVLVEPGNDFPCDFTKPPGVRDAVCAKGDVCGVDNRCRRFQYEGPQFEGLPTFPFFGDGGARLHPMLMTGPVDFVAQVSGGAPFDFVALGDAGSFLFTTAGGTSIALSRNPAELDDPIVFGRYRPDPTDAGVLEPRLIGLEPDGTVYCDVGPTNRVRDGMQSLRAKRLRSFPPQPMKPTTFAAVSTNGRAGVIDVIPAATFTPLTSVGPPIDTALGPSVVGRGRAPLSLGSDGIRLLLTDGGTDLVVAASFPEASTLFSDRDGTVYAIVSAGAGKVTLSTYSMTRTSAGFSIDSPWSDCAPCGGLVAPLAVTAGTDLGGPFVEVLCEQEGLRQIRGATSSNPNLPCLEDSATLPFDFGALQRRQRGLAKLAVQDTSATSGFLAGGRSGQIWVGETMSSAKPLFLDRVPADITTFESPAVKGLIALTPVGLFLRPNDPAAAQASNGFRAVAPEAKQLLLALVHQGRGWGVTQQGHLINVDVDAMKSFTTTFGPQLVDGRGEPVTRALYGEGFQSSDGGLVSMLIAADDSLYFVPTPPMVARAPGLLNQVSPVLTPEPSTLIRSFALERTPIGTDGVSRVRGYLVTSRNVYEFKLGGAPLQWTARPLALSGAEPVEVWFDNPRGGLGRVGYRDGTVFSLPGGFPLTAPLPANDGGIPASVTDYENLGGWPVALTSAGLFVAQYDASSTGRLETRFPDGGLNKPMTWREVTLPDGSRPWLPRDPTRLEARPGKLFVVADPQTGTDMAYRQLFHLLVFLPNHVLEVGHHERKNMNTVRN
jgi:hypothetical protein